MVDLQDIYDVHNVTLYGRTGGHAYRFRDLEILVFKENPFENNSSQPMTCAQKKGKLSRPDVLTCNPSTTGRFVLLQYIKPNRKVLTVCEVEVGGKLSKGRKAAILVKTNDVSNLALRKPTYGCTDYDKYSNPNHVVDGNKGGYRRRGQCFTSAKSVSRPWWMVDLQDIYDVHNVTLYGRSGGHAYRFRDLEILVFKENPFENNSSQPMTCAQKKGKLSRPDVLTCNPSTTGRFVLLQYIKPNKKVLTVCEVEVGGKLFKGRKAAILVKTNDVSNLALRKPTYGCTDYDKYSDPNHVVDGNKGGYRRRGQCFTSAKSVSRPWWMVDLQDIYDVHNVTLYGRTGGHANKFRDLEILVFKENPFENNSSQPMTCAQKKGKLSRPDVLTCNPSTTGRFVLLQYIKPNKKVLTVCEVEVGGKLFNGRKAAILVKTNDVSNLALRKPTYGCTDYDKYSNPNHVVDGNKGGYRRRGQCFTSAKSVSRPWWMVDLQDIYDVHNVTLYGRTGGHANKFRDLEILVFKENPFENNSSQPMTCAQKKGKLSRPDVLTCNPSTTGRFVLLQYIKPNKKVLTVCEVEVGGKLF
ncbi:uncharacterized protein LOC124112633 [Haliotis rufescens]|uniref:uncharacterized protein LOC124112633 n=1 Tax=Haliotis rufescens TaxID=6454 RepID=UPI00201F7511|nr:uncharacterized protein LOC124112633 [Haliotis rufescens]